MPSRYKRRSFSVRIPPLARAEMERFLERVAEAVKSYGASIRVEGDKVIVEVYGQEFMIRDSWIRLKKLLSEYSQPRGERGYSLRLIAREVGLAVPGDVLAVVLREEGSRASYGRGEFIETDAGFDHVLDAAARVKRAIEESKLLNASRTAKKAIITVAALTGSPVSRVVEAGLDSGILSEDEEGKIIIRRPWHEVVRELREAVEHGIRGSQA